jgi:hypothetical protein
MKTRIPIIVKDPAVTAYKEIQPTETFTFENERFLLDGPVAERVAVLDFDEKTGALKRGARFEPPPPGKKIATYKIKDINKLHSRDFQQVSVFGTVLKTMMMFEEADVLGRRISWAFNSPQLLVVPRAGEWENAFYERESRSLQFFFFRSGKTLDPNLKYQMIYTCLSQDIVAHETAHAILDGIAPDLYNAITPQSLALHEAIADLTALNMAFRCRELVTRVLEVTNGNIEKSDVFNGLAGEFQEEKDPGGRKLFLRNLLNGKTLNRNDKSVDENGDPNLVMRDEPHDLSEVLSGALYSVMVRMYNEQRAPKSETKLNQNESFERALWVAAQRFKRMILRALDYLPPGEVSFADYGRAIIAADQASYPDKNVVREWIKDEFYERRIVNNRNQLDVKTNFEHSPLKKIDLQVLVESDWAAYQFANENRKFLGIPKDIHFRVKPRLDTTKNYYLKDKQQTQVRECLFKVSWDILEDNKTQYQLPSKRQLTVGTTLAIDWKTRNVRALLTSDKLKRQTTDRDLMLKRLMDQGKLLIGDAAMGADGNWLCTAVRAEKMNEMMRVRGAARMLHICR